jgi:outer membrane lipoprotein LolB
VIQHLRLVLTGFLLATILIAGCAIPKRTEHQNQPETPVWRGRLALQIEPDSSQAQASSFSAGFELTGNAQVGELTLFTPLGSTAASLIWSEKSALMRTSSDTRHFDSLDALIKHAIGTELPVATLFAWLAAMQSLYDIPAPAKLNLFAHHWPAKRRLPPDCNRYSC